MLAKCMMCLLDKCRVGHPYLENPLVVRVWVVENGRYVRRVTRSETVMISSRMDDRDDSD